MMWGDLLIALIVLVLAYLVLAPTVRPVRMIATAMVDNGGAAAYASIDETYRSRRAAQAAFDKWYTDLGDAYLVSLHYIPTKEHTQ